MNSFQDTNKKSNRFLAYLIVGLSITWFIGTVFIYGLNEESIRMNIRWTARFSVVCFLLAFGASAFHTFFQNGYTQWLLKNRKYLGVSFAVIHFIHLFHLKYLHENYYPVFVHRSITELLLGGIAYFFIGLMFYTSFEKFSNLFSQRNWNRIHTIGGYWILIVFSNSIIGRVVGGKMAYLPLAILVLSVWILRLFKLRKKA